MNIDNSKKMIAYGVGAVLVLLLIYIVVQLVKKDDEEKLVDTLKNEVDTTNLTYSEGEYLTLADTIHSGMIGYGTDEQTIYDILEQMKTQDDLKKLIASFGTRKDHWMYSFFSGTLNAWLRQELDAKEVEKVKEIYNQLGVAF